MSEIRLFLRPLEVAAGDQQFGQLNPSREIFGLQLNRAGEFLTCPRPLLQS